MNQNTSTGLDLFLGSTEYRNRNIGILTNQSGVGSCGTPNIELLLAAGFRIKTIFVPEHGLRGSKGGGERIEDHMDPHYNIPVVSLYNEKLRIDSDKFKDIDMLLYDIQDVGARFYTYIATLKAILGSISESGQDIKVAILDRPAFLGDSIQGTLPDEISFLSPEFIPIRYGLTVGEFALYTARINNYDTEIEIFHIPDYHRGMQFPDTGVPFISPSSAIRNYETALIYSGTCLLEGTDLSEGRGTDTPFLAWGSPDMPDIKVDFSGFEIKAYEFIPEFSKFSGKKIKGFRAALTDRDSAEPFRDMVLFLMAFHKQRPIDFRLPHFDHLTGGSFIREMICEGNKAGFLSRLKEDQEKFRESSEDFRLYSF